MAKFAEGTSVSVEKSKGEIERLIMRAGATHYGTMNEPQAQTVAFRMNNFSIRFTVPCPPVKDFKEYDHGRGGTRKRTDKGMWDAWEKEMKRRWRALLLVIKAKLEAVDTGITTFEEEFLPHIVIKGGQTIAEVIIPQLAERTSGRLPLLPGPK